MTTEATAFKLASIDRAAADQRLSHLDFRLLWLLVSAADRKTGIARRKQIDLARMLGTHRRTVQRCRDRLVSLGYLGPVAQKPGGYVSAYNVLLSIKAAPVSPFIKGGVDAALEGGVGVQKGGAPVQKGGPPTAHDPLSSLDIPSEPNRETAVRGPRCAEVALGPLGAKLCQRIGHAAFEAWLGKGQAEIVSQTGAAITLAVKSKFFATEIRNRFESDILACLQGVARCEFVVREAGPPTGKG